MIGAGDVAEKKSGPAFQKAPASHLVAVMRRDAQRAQDFAQRHQVPEWYDDAEALLKHPEIDDIYVATPPATHREYAVRALQAGKDVYLEKPMAISMEECHHIAEAVKQTGRKLVLAHYRRALPAFMKVRQLLKEQVVGAIKIVEIRVLQPPQTKMIAQTEEPWRTNPAVSGGGFFHDIAPHQLDLLYYYLGKPTSMHGHAFSQAQLYPAEDIVSASMVFSNDIVFQGLWCFTVPEDEASAYCKIIGARGSILFSFSGTEVQLHAEVEKTFHFELPEHIQQPMVEQVNAYFRGEGDNPCSAEEGLQVMAMLQAVTNRA